MIIPTEIIEDVLRPYNCKVLKSANLEYPFVRGRFLIGPTYYHIPPFEHATDIDIQLCLNQLAYAGVAEAIRRKIIPELDGLNFDELRTENMLIIESRKRFKRSIRTDVEIGGEIKIARWKEFRGLLLANGDFQFENRSCFGELELAIVKSGALT